MSKKEQTRRIFNPKYKVDEPYLKPAKHIYDTSDWDYRKFKKYDEFTRSFDTNIHLEKK